MDGSSCRGVRSLFLLFVVAGAADAQRAPAPGEPSVGQLVSADCLPVFVAKARETEQDPEGYARLLCGVLASTCEKSPSGSECKTAVGAYDLDRGDTGPSVLYKAAERGKTEAIRTMLQMGYSPNAPLGGPGWTPLMIAAANGHEEAVGVLVEAGAEPNARNAVGRTALMFAADGGYARVVETLLTNGADPDALPGDPDDLSALMVAAAAGDREVVESLIAHGAERALKNGRGRSALDFAEAAGHAEIAGVLRSAEQAP